MSLWKPVELALAGGARLAWPVFQAINRRFEAKSFQPQWATAPLMKSHERTSPPLGWPRTTDSLCPDLRARDARADPLRRTGDRVARQPARRRDPGRHPRARRQDHHREDLPDSRDLHRHARDQPGFPQAHRIALPGPRFRRGHRPAAQPRHVVDQARPRRGADDRPHQPLQHDVRSVLHGRQSGRLRPRADARRSQATARRRGEHQAAAADDGAVLGRRADDFADLPRRRPLRAPGRLLQRPGGHQRHPLRAGARSSRARRARPACGSPTCSSTA